MSVPRQAPAAIATEVPSGVPLWQVRAALRLLEDRETRLRALRQSLIAGERSGASTPFDFDEFVSRKRAEDPRGR